MKNVRSSKPFISMNLFSKARVFRVSLVKLTKSKYRIKIRAPKLWNIILSIEADADAEAEADADADASTV